MTIPIAVAAVSRMAAAALTIAVAAVSRMAAAALTIAVAAVSRMATAALTIAVAAVSRIANHCYDHYYCCRCQSNPTALAIAVIGFRIGPFFERLYFASMNFSCIVLCTLLVPFPCS